MLEKYVGVTGITNRKEVLLLNNLLDDFNIVPHEYNLMYGFLVDGEMSDYLSSHGTRGYEKGNKEFVNVGHLPGLLKCCDKNVITAIHFNTNSPTRLAEQLGTVLEHGNVYDDGLCRMVQLNIKHPLLEEVKQIRNDYPGLKLVLQTNPFYDDLLYYDSSLFDYVIIDHSRGKGISMNIEDSVGAYRLLEKKGFGEGIVFAGGLGPENVTSVCEGLWKVLGRRDFSIDAQSGLRNNGVLDAHKVTKYVDNAFRFFFFFMI